jgi:hypothetical protein
MTTRRAGWGAEGPRRARERTVGRIPPEAISAEDVGEAIRAALKIEEQQHRFYRVHPNIRKFFEYEPERQDRFNDRIADLYGESSPYVGILDPAERFWDCDDYAEACQHAWNLDDLVADVLELRRRGWSEIAVRRGGRLYVTVHRGSEPSPGLTEWQRGAFRSIVKWRYDRELRPDEEQDRDRRILAAWLPLPQYPCSHCGAALTDALKRRCPRCSTLADREEEIVAVCRAFERQRMRAGEMV